MVFSFTNSKGQIYYLHSKEGKGGAKLFYFSKDPSGAIDLPEGFEVFENPKTCLPMIRKKK
ncbi:MAG: hypothetical protein QXR09_00940 [Candidatus Aenigmatarchaeota archaeon]